MPLAVLLASWRLWGIGVLRLDFTGLGASEGAFEDTSFSSNIEDIAVGAEWLAAHHGEARLLVGHSLGGAAVLAAAARLPQVKGGGDDWRAF